MKFFTTTALLLASLALSLPANAATLRVGLDSDPDVLDPAQSRSYTGRLVYASLCDKLIDVAPDLSFTPQLATDWSFDESGTKLTMKLREGVTFHDGEPFNADAVVYNINRFKTMPESLRKSELTSIETIEAVNDHEVLITLVKADAALLAALSDRAGMMVSPKAAEALGVNFGSAPICAGPFKFVERVAQDRIVLERFNDYWNAENIFLDGVSFIGIPDTSVRLANLRSGDLDFIERIAPTDVSAVENDPNLSLYEVVSLGYLAVYFNVNSGPNAEHPLGQNKLLRQAFSHAIDREAINQVVFSGGALPGNQPFAPNSPWFAQNHPVEGRDIAKAKALVAEAGFDRIAVTVKHANSPIIAQAMQMIQAMVAEAGFDISLQATEFATLLDDKTRGDFQVVRSDWSGRVDPDGNIHQFFTCGGGQNDPKYCNPEVDQLLNDARTINDIAVRKEKYDAAMDILMDDLPILFLGHPKYQFAMNKNVTGFETAADAMIRLTGVRFEK